MNKVKIEKYNSSTCNRDICLWNLATPSPSFAADESATETSNATVSGEAEKETISAALMGMNQTVMERVIFGAALGLMVIGIATGSDSEPRKQMITVMAMDIN